MSDHCPACPMRADEDCHGHRDPNFCRFARQGHAAVVRDGNERIYQGKTAPGDATGQPPVPSLLARAATLARSVAAHLADGGRIAPQEVQDARATICGACPLLANGRCSKCGCIAMATKRSWASSACPDDPPRWGAV